MQRKDLALRVLSTATFLAMVASCVTPAFADVYYIGNGSIDVVTKEDADGKKYVEVKQGDKTYTDTSDEIVIKDGNNEGNAAQKEESRIEGKKAKVAIPDKERPATQEAAGPEAAAGESQPDPDAGFTLNETEEDSARTQEGKDTTEEEKEPAEDSPKKDVVYQLDPADPEPEQQATKPASTAPAEPEATAPETTLAAAPTAAPAADPATTTPAEGSAKKPTKNVIRVINNWAEKVLNIRLSNVNIKVDDTSRYADGTREQFGNGKKGVSAAEVQGTGKTKIELDGQNLLDSSKSEYWAGLNKKDSGNLTITDETSDKGETITTKGETETSGSLRAEGGTTGGAAIGGNCSQATDNITIEGYATVKANTLDHGSTLYDDGAGIGGGAGKKGSNITIQGHANVTANSGRYGAGIGGGGRYGSYGGDAENITIRDYAKVTARSGSGAAIGSGSGGYIKGGNAKHIVIQGHATVVAKSYSTAIGAAYGDDVDVTIGTEGPMAAEEDVHVTATNAGIGNGTKDTRVTIQGHATIRAASDDVPIAIGSNSGDVTVTIKDNVTIDSNDATGNATSVGVGSGIGGRSDSSKKVVVNIDGGKHGKVKIGENSAIFGVYGAISGTEVNIGDNVLLKMEGKSSSTYIWVNGAEAEVGTRDNPGAGGLVNTIGDNTELWYSTRDGKLQKIVHSKNLCKKSPTEHITKQPTCTAPGFADYTCDYEHTNGAAHPSCNRTWTDKVPALGHHWTDNGDNSTHICVKGDATEAHAYGEWTTVTPATCTTAGQKQHTCTECGHIETQEIPVTGHHWKDNGDGTHTCPDCGATEGQPFNTNSALELRVVDAEGMDQPFTVSQNGTLRTYTGAYDTATLTGDLNTLRYLQDHGAQTIQFVTNGQTSSFAISDLLAQGSGSEVFYLTHRGAEEPTLLLVEADHSELVKD